MSAPISPSLPSSDPNSADADLRFVEAFAFEGADELWRSWRDGLTPDPLLTVSEWADRHRFLSPRASAEPGRYRTDRTPYMRAIMDALSPSHPVRRIVFMKAAQVGATEAGNNWIGYVIHHAPGPMLSVQPTVELAKRFSRQRIEPLIAESPSLRERVKPSRARDAGNTVLSKEFPAGLLVISGANNPVITLGSTSGATATNPMEWLARISIGSARKPPMWSVSSSMAAAAVVPMRCGRPVGSAASAPNAVAAGIRRLAIRGLVGWRRSPCAASSNCAPPSRLAPTPWELRDP